jgi:ATP-dependent RNA helicase DHX29
MLAIKTLRSQMRQMMTQFFRKPGRELSLEQQAWMDIWQKVFSASENRNA